MRDSNPISFATGLPPDGKADLGCFPLPAWTAAWRVSILCGLVGLRGRYAVPFLLNWRYCR